METVTTHGIRLDPWFLPNARGIHGQRPDYLEP